VIRKFSFNSLILAFLVFFSSNNASAEMKKMADGDSICKITAYSYAVFKEDVDINDALKLENKAYISIDDNPIKGVKKLFHKGDYIRLIACDIDDNYVSILFGVFDGDRKVTIYRRRASETEVAPRHFGPFSIGFESAVDFIYDDSNFDPYSDFPLDVKISASMKKITNFYTKDQFEQTLSTFRYIENLGVDLPEEFEFYYIKCLSKSGFLEKAKERASNYFKKYKNSGKYSSQVVDIISAQ